MKTITVSSFLLSTILFSGCGGGVSDRNHTAKQPHDSSILNRTASLEKDWTWDVGFRADIKGRATVLSADFWAGVPDEVVNFQYFIDMDNNQDTGFSGSNGWQVKGADFLIENADVYKSVSNSQWKWKLVGTFQNNQFTSISGLGTLEKVSMSDPTPTLTNHFDTQNFKVMIEVFDENWLGNYCTVTEVNAEVSNSSTVDQNLATIEESIRAKYNANKFTTVTTIDFAPNKQEAIVAKINKWEGKNLYVINVSDTDTSTIFAKEYKNKFVYKTIVVKDNGIVEFQIKEDNGQKFQVVYDYKNNKEISKTLIDKAKKYVLTEVKMDTYGDGVSDMTYHNSYDDRGNIIQKIVYDASEDATYTSTFIYNANNHLLVSDINDDYENQHRVFTYDEQGRKETMTHNSADNSYKTYFTYDDRGNLIKEDETGNYDGEDEHRVRTYVYNANNQLLQKKFKIGIDYTSLDLYEYDGDNLLKETHSYNGENQNTKEYVYNDNNQLVKKIKKTRHSQNVYEYSYNENGKLKEEIYTNPHDMKTVTKYSYDQNNNLIKKENTHVTTVYVWEQI